MKAAQFDVIAAGSSFAPQTSRGAVSRIKEKLSKAVSKILFRVTASNVCVEVCALYPNKDSQDPCANSELAEVLE